MTTHAYVHEPIPPFPRISGAIAVANITRDYGLSVESEARLTIAADDVELDWLRSGMCWMIDQPDIGEPIWAGFVETEVYPLDAESVPVQLSGPKRGLLTVEGAVRLQMPTSSGYAVEQMLLAAQSQGAGMFPGTIEQVGGEVNIDIRGETISRFINTVTEVCFCDWRERIILKPDNTLEFLLDFGLLKNETNIVLGRNELVTGLFERERVIRSVTALSQAGGFATRTVATVRGEGSRTAAAEPAHGVLVPQNEKVSELIAERDIGPAATRHLITISERVAPAGIGQLAQQRQEDLLKDVESITFTLDATKAEAQRVRIGDVVQLDVPDWFKTLDVNAKVHIREITPQDSAGEKDVVASIVL